MLAVMVSCRTWELQRVFLRSKFGFTPFVLVEYPGYFQKGVREWGIFTDVAATSQRDLEKWISKKYFNIEGLWKRNGRNMRERDVYDWIASGCQNSVSVEELMVANPDLYFAMSYIDSKTHKHKMREITSTDDWDRWLEDSGLVPTLFGLHAASRQDCRLNLPAPDPLFSPDREVILPVTDTKDPDTMYYYGTELGIDGEPQYLFTYNPSCAAVLSEEQAADVATVVERKELGEVLPFFDASDYERCALAEPVFPLATLTK